MSKKPADEQKLSIKEYYEKARADREWYFRTTIKIRPKNASLGLIPLEMRPGQKKLMDAIDNARRSGRPPRVIILKARQIGFSTVTDMELLRCCHLYEHQQALVVAHRTESTEILFENIRRAHNAIPKPVRPVNRFSNKRVLHFKENDSRIEVSVAGETRGFTAQMLHVSELAFIDGAGALMTAIMQTVPDTLDSLVILESTPNGVGNEFHNLWVAACKPGGNEWIPVFIPWFDEPTYAHSKARVTLEELEARQDDAAIRAKEIMRLHPVSLEQISWWLTTLENKCFGDLDRMEQEYASDPQSCFLASGRRVFDRDGIKHYAAMSGITDDMGKPEPKNDEREADLIQDAEQPKKVTKRAARGSKLRIYRDFNPRHRYIIGADISAGDPGSDYTPILAFNRHTLDYDAVWYGKLPPEMLADQAMLMGYYYGVAQIAGEANNHGILFNHRLLERQYPNIYFRKTSEESVAGKVTDKPGFFTSGANREHLFNLLRRYVAEKAGRIEDERLVYEMMTLQYDDNDRVDHPEGGSSDLCVAASIVLAVHAGSFDASLAPLTMEQNAAAMAAYDDIRSARLVGADVSRQLAALDVLGMSIEDCDRLEFNLQAQAKRRERFGLGGMS